MKSPLVVKMRFKTPTKNNQKLNRNYATYIATRPGTVMESPKSLLEEFSPETSAGHVKYASERPGSHGLFGKDPKESISLTSIQSELAKHEGIVWQYIVSLREDDAAELGIENRGDWERFMRATTNQVFKEMGIPSSNGRWVAAFHEEAGHPHVHLMMWEKNVKKVEGKLDRKEMKNVRNVFINHIAKEEKQQLNVMKTISRDTIKDRVSEVLDGTLLSLINKSEMPQKEIKLETDQLKSMHTYLKELSEIMPTKGRLAYGYMPEEVKAYVDEISNWMMKQPQFKKDLHEYETAVSKLARFHVKDDMKINASIENAIQDLRKRIGNQVIKSAGIFRKSHNPEVKTQHVEKMISRIVEAKTPVTSLEKAVMVETKNILVSKGLSEEDMFKVLNELKSSGNLEIPLKELHDVPKVNVVNIENKLKDLLPFSSHLQQRLNMRVDTKEIKNSLPSISRSEWEILKRNFQSKGAYPYKIERHTELNISKRELQDAVIKMRLPENDLRGTMFKQLIVMNEAQIDAVTQKYVLQECLKHNNQESLDITKWINDKINKFANQKFMAGQNLWKTLQKNTGLKIDYPFNHSYEAIPNKEQAKAALQEILSSPQQIKSSELPPPQLKTIDKLVKLASEDTYEEAKNKNALERIGLRLSDKTQPFNQMDLDALNRKWELGNKEKVTTHRIATVLLSAGLAPEETKSIMERWNTSSKSNISEANLIKSIDNIVLKNEELSRYGGVTTLSKNEFKNLARTLNLKDLTNVYSYPKDLSQSRVASDLWKSVFKSIRNEQMKSDYEIQKNMRKRLQKERANERKRGRGI